MNITAVEYPRVPPLESGDELDQREFHRRFSAMTHLKKAELIEGIVFMPSPVSLLHAKAHQTLSTWIGTYAAKNPKVEAADNATVILDDLNEVQPDICLRLLPEHGGRSQLDADGYLAGPPELVVEISITTASIDMRHKREVYLRSGVREYLVWVVLDRQIHWWTSNDVDFRPIQRDPEGVLESLLFPGLRLKTDELLAGDLAAILLRLE